MGQVGIEPTSLVLQTSAKTTSATDPRWQADRSERAFLFFLAIERQLKRPGVAADTGPDAIDGFAAECHKRKGWDGILPLKKQQPFHLESCIALGRILNMALHSEENWLPSIHLDAARTMQVRGDSHLSPGFRKYEESRRPPVPTRPGLGKM